MLSDSDREDKAVLALIAGTLRRQSGEVREEEINAFLKASKPLSSEGRAALDKLGTDPFKGLAQSPAKPPIKPANPQQLAAMHREASDAELSDETQVMLEQARREVLERLRNRKSPQPRSES